MKTKMLTVLLWCFALQLEAQHFQVVDQTEFENAAKVIASLPDGGFYVGATAGVPGLGFSSSRLFLYDFDGSERWQIGIPGSERHGPTDLQVLSDGSVLVCGYNAGCDVGGYGYLLRVDTTGSILWHVYEDYIDPPMAMQIGEINFMALGIDGQVCVMDDYGVHVFSTVTGDYIETFPTFDLGLGTVNDIHYLQSNNRIYFAGEDGVLSFNPFTGTVEQVVIEPDPSGPFTEFIPLENNSMLVYSYDGDSYVLDETGVLDTFDWTGYGAHAVDRNMDGQYAMYTAENVYVFDTVGQMKHQFNPWLAGITVNDIGWSNGRIVLSGFETHTNHVQLHNTAMWVQSYDTSGVTYNNVQEVEMLEVIKTQQPMATLVLAPYYSITGGTFDVRVRNLSFATLDSVSVHAAYFGYDIPAFCPTSSFKSVTYYDLNLGVAEEITLSFGLLESPYVAPWNINPWKVCMWVGNPNGQTDNDHSNNLACLDVYPTVSAKEPEAGAFALFPNPATDVCTITWGENAQPETVQLFDAFGRLLHSETLDSSVGQYGLELGALPSGVYTVILNKAARRLVKM